MSEESEDGAPMVIHEPQEDSNSETLPEQEITENLYTTAPNGDDEENANLVATDLPWRISTFKPKKKTRY